MVYVEGGLEIAQPDQGPQRKAIWVFPKIRHTFFEGPHNKDYNILGSILGSPIIFEHGDRPG